MEQQSGTYAQVAAQQNVFEKKLEELEAALLAKDKKIAKLQEESKRKDERIEQMMAFIKQVKQHTNQERVQHASETVVVEKPRHSREQRVAHLTAGPMTRSRNNSPAVQDTKRGRPPKFNYPKPAPHQKPVHPNQRRPQLVHTTSHKWRIPAKSLRYRRHPLTSVFDSSTLRTCLNNIDDSRANMDNEIIRFGSRKSVEPLPTQVRQAEGIIRHVLPKPVDDEVSSVVDGTLNHTTILQTHRHINHSSSKKKINTYACNN